MLGKKSDLAWSKEHLNVRPLTRHPKITTAIDPLECTTMNRRYSEQGLSNLDPKRIHMDILTLMHMSNLTCSDSNTFSKHCSSVAVGASDMMSSAYINLFTNMNDTEQSATF